jgi:DNA-binding beta-propeller fold protein YncE
MVEAVMLSKRILFLALALACLAYFPTVAATQPAPQLLSVWGTPGSGPGELDEPWGVAVDAAGFVYVADTRNSRVCKFTGTGQFVLSWATTGARGIAVDAAGHILVGGVLIRAFTPEGEFLYGFWAGAIHDITVSPSGAIYAVDLTGGSGYTDHITQYGPDGTFIRTFGAGGNHPRGVAVDSAGTVYFSDYYNRAIYKYSAAGTMLTNWLCPGEPGGITFDGAGNLCVSDRDNGEVHVFTPSGSLVSSWGMGMSTLPGNIAFGPDGSIFVTDWNCHVLKFGYTPTPTQSVTWGSMKARYRGERGAAPSASPDR